MDRLYNITKRGKRVSGDISADSTPSMSVLRYLHEMGTSDTSTISSHVGMSNGAVSRILRKLESNNLVENLSRSSNV